jgi:hypothetical protein
MSEENRVCLHLKGVSGVGKAQANNDGLLEPSNVVDGLAVANEKEPHGYGELE